MQQKSNPSKILQSINQKQAAANEAASSIQQSANELDPLLKKFRHSKMVKGLMKHKTPDKLKLLFKSYMT